MKNKNIFRLLMLLAVPVLTGLVISRPAIAHCDGLDGPVIRAAQKALETAT